MTAPKKKPVKQEPVPLARKNYAVDAVTPEEGAAKIATLTASPGLAASRVIGAVEIYGAPSAAALLDIPSLVKVLDDQAAAVNNGDLALCESMLINQAVALQSLFARLIERGTHQSLMPHAEIFMRLALRAQAQSARTLQILGELKNPTIFARQANIAHGPQQINNGTIAGAPATQNTPNKLLLEELPNERLDTRTQGPSIVADPAMATVEAVHRPEVASG